MPTQHLRRGTHQWRSFCAYTAHPWVHGICVTVWCCTTPYLCHSTCAPWKCLCSPLPAGRRTRSHIIPRGGRAVHVRPIQGGSARRVPRIHPRTHRLYSFPHHVWCRPPFIGIQAHVHNVPKRCLPFVRDQLHDMHISVYTQVVPHKSRLEAAHEILVEDMHRQTGGIRATMRGQGGRGTVRCGHAYAHTASPTTRTGPWLGDPPGA